MSGFKVPEDLADTDLTMTEVKEILDNRKAYKRIKNRLDGLPEKAGAFRKALTQLDKDEAAMLRAAATRREADAKREATAAEGQTAPTSE